MNVAYTYIFGGWDWLKTPIKSTPGWKYICFTDEDNPWLPGFPQRDWQIVKVKTHLTPKREAGYYLTHGTDHFPEADLILSVTGQCHIIGDLNEFAKLMPNDYALMHHPKRNCTYKEASAVKRHGKDLPEVIDKQMERYRADGFPEANGMVQTGIILRRNTPQVKRFEHLWWDEIEKGSQRDQLSWNYTHWKNPIVKVDHWTHTADIQNKLIAVTPHYRSKGRTNMTHIPK